MNQAFLILAYKNPEQLRSFLKQLESEDSYFFIHLDLKSDLKSFKEHTSNIKNIKYIKKRLDLRWGSFEIINAIYNLIEDIKHSRLLYSHAHLLTGEDISLKPINEINAFFSDNKQIDYINYFQLPSTQWTSGGMHRVLRYYLFQDGRSNYKIKLLLSRLTNYFVNNVLVNILPLIKKKVPEGINLYGGSSYWSLTQTTIEWLLDNKGEFRKLLKFFKTSFAPDEMVFQTILMNYKSGSILLNDNRRHIDWKKSVNGSPTILGVEDYEVLKKSSCFFARKVDYSAAAVLYKELAVNTFK